jgi:hypothetical protein
MAFKLHNKNVKRILDCPFIPQSRNFQGLFISGVCQELREYASVNQNFGPYPCYFHDNDRICVRCIYRISHKTHGSTGEATFDWGEHGSRRSLHQALLSKIAFLSNTPT